MNTESRVANRITISKTLVCSLCAIFFSTKAVVAAQEKSAVPNRIYVTTLENKFPNYAVGPTFVQSIVHTEDHLYFGLTTKLAIHQGKEGCPEGQGNQIGEYVVFQRGIERDSDIIPLIEKPEVCVTMPIPLHASDNNNVYAGVAPFLHGHNSQLVINEVRQDGEDWTKENVTHSAKWDFSIDNEENYALFFVNGADPQYGQTQQRYDVWYVDLKADDWTGYDLLEQSTTSTTQLMYTRIDYWSNKNKFILSWNTLPKGSENALYVTAHLAIFDPTNGGTLTNISGNRLEMPSIIDDENQATLVFSQTDKNFDPFLLGSALRTEETDQGEMDFYYLLYSEQLRNVPPGGSTHQATLAKWNLTLGSEEYRCTWPKEEKLDAWNIGLVEYNNGVAAVGVYPSTEDRRNGPAVGVVYDIDLDTGMLGKQLAQSEESVVDATKDYYLANSWKTTEDGTFFAITGGQVGGLVNRVRLWEGQLKLIHSDSFESNSVEKKQAINSCQIE